MTPTSRKSLPVKRTAPLPTAAGDMSPKAPKFFTSKATSSSDGEVSFPRASFGGSYDDARPKYKDEASEARLSPDDPRIPTDDNGAFAMTDEDKVGVYLGDVVSFCLFLMHVVCVFECLRVNI